MNRDHTETRTSATPGIHSERRGKLADRRHVEEALRESEEKFRVLAGNSLVGIYFIQDGLFQYVNAKFAEIFEYKIDEFPSLLQVKDLIFPEDVPLVEESLRKKMAGELESLHYEFRILTKNKDIKYAEVYSSRTFYKGQPAVIGTLLDITERRRMAEALAGSEKRFRQLADATFEGIIIHDTSRILDVNQAIVQMSGYDADALIGRELQAFVAPESIDHIWRHIHSECGGVFEIQVVRRDGSLLTVEAMGRPILYDGMRAKVVALHDLTERKRMEASLRESEERYRLIAENMTDSIWIMNMELKLVWMSLSAERQQGFSLAELNAMPLNRHLTGDSFAMLFHQLANNMAPAKLRQKDLDIGWIVDLEFIRKNGATFWSEVSFTLLRDPQGLPIGLLCVGRDITRRKEAEQALRVSEERFARVFNMSPIATCISTIDEGRYVDVNDSHLQALGYSREEMIGRTSAELKVWAKPDDRDKFKRMLTEPGFIRGDSFQMRTKAGEILDVLVSAEIITLKEGKFVLSISSDITEQRKLEEQLRRSQKMEAIGTLAGGIAHDFNNILGGIMGYTELSLANYIKPGHPAHGFLEGTLRSAHRAKDLVAQMMAFSRRQEQKRVPLKMGPIIKEALKLLRASLPATINVGSHIESEGLVFADPTQIHQVLMNLITNSAHAMKGTKGKIEVFLKPATFRSKDAVPHPDLILGVEYQELMVRDSGHGIDPNHIPRIFDPFFTTKKTGEGTGLGLSVVYGIIKSYNGIVTVESELGKGTIFRIYIPEITGPVMREHRDTVPAPGGTERILFVDDEYTLVEIFGMQLMSLGYAVTSYNEPLKALDDFRKHPADYDLVITDMTMPDMTGMDLAGELILIRPDIPIVLCTGMIEQIDPDRFSRLGIRQCIKKPITIHDLASAIRPLLDTH